MKKLLLSLAVAAMSATAFAGQVQDVLTVSNFKTADGKDLAPNSYVVATYTSATTGITYTIQGSKTQASYGEGLQFRSKNNNSGLVITANPKGATFKSATFKACTGPTTNNTMEFYGNTAAYTNPTDLYGENKGTSIGTLKQNETAAMNASADFNFIGMRSTSGAVYLETITFTYEIAGETGKKSADLAFSETSFTITEGETFTAPTLTKATTAEVVYSTSNENVADVNAATGAVTIMGVGEAVITAKTAENDEYYAGEASYRITVESANTIFSSNLGTEFTFEVLSGDLETVWKHDNTYGLKAQAFSNGVHAAEALAISPVIDLNNRKNIVLNFQNAFNNYKLNNVMIGVADFKGYAFIMAREEGATEWTQVAEATAPESFSWNFFDNAPVSLEAYKGKKMQFAYKYVSTADVAGTWEVKNIVVTGEKDNGVGVVESFVSDENAPVVYYNLQGVKVANPTEGMYIRVQGSKSTKVMIRK